MQIIEIGPLARPVRVTKKPTKTKKPHSGKLGVSHRRNHPVVLVGRGAVLAPPL